MAKKPKTADPMRNLDGDDELEGGPETQGVTSDSVGDVDHDAEPDDPPTPPPAPRPLELVSRKITVPLAPPPPSCQYVPEHVAVRLSPRQGLALRKLMIALDQKGERAFGPYGTERSRVTCLADSVRWLLEQLEPTAD